VTYNITPNSVNAK